jgi:hypothetical protein
LLLAGKMKELKPLSALPWTLLPVVEEGGDVSAAGKPVSRKREWRGVGFGGPAARKRQRTVAEFQARDFAELEDWEEGVLEAKTSIATSCLGWGGGGWEVSAMAFRTPGSLVRRPGVDGITLIRLHWE